MSFYEKDLRSDTSSKKRVKLLIEVDIIDSLACSYHTFNSLIISKNTIYIVVEVYLHKAGCWIVLEDTGIMVPDVEASITASDDCS